MVDRGIGRKLAQGLLASSAMLAPLTIPSQAIAGTAQSPTPATVNLNIPAQGLGPALSEFARQSNQQLLYSPGLVKGKRSSAVSGALAPADGLRQLLAGSGVSFSTASSGAFLLSSGSPQGNGRGGADSAPSTGVEAAASENPGASEPIVVTGTHIRGAGPVGSSPTVITSADIKAAGYSRLEDTLASVTQNFAATNQASAFQGRANTFNTNGGASVELRGLGLGSTLTLIDGHRQPSSGLWGSYVDISTIPQSAVDRVEILTDGASAIYGSDAIGGVVNVILKKDYSGAETTIRSSVASGWTAPEIQISQLFGKAWAGGNLVLGYQYYHRDPLKQSERAYTAANGDLRAFGGTDQRVLGSVPGEILLGGKPAFAIPGGQDGTHLTVSQLLSNVVNYKDTVDDIDDLGSIDTHSLFLVARQDVTSWFSLYAEGRLNFRHTTEHEQDFSATVSVPKTNPFYVNPFGGTGPVSVAYDFRNIIGPTHADQHTQTYGATVGGVAKLGGDWRLDTNVTYGQDKLDDKEYNTSIPIAVRNAALADSNPTTALNVFGDGSGNNPSTIAKLQSFTNYKALSSITALDAVADGPIHIGDARVAMGMDLRREALTSNNIQAGTMALQSVSRNIAAGFVELTAPIVAPDNDVPFINRLEISAAARYEHYSDFGNTTNPKIGALWAPIRDLHIRGTWGKSFRAPNFGDISTALHPSVSAAESLPDPSAPGGVAKALILQGANPGVKPERATTWSAGFDWTPRRIAGLKFSTSYFDIQYKDKVAAAPFSALGQADVWAPVITRNPTAAQIAAICDRPDFLVDLVGACTGTATVIVDMRSFNLAQVKTNGLDLDTSYSHPIEGGTLGLGLTGTYVFSYRQAATADAPAVEVVGTLGNPVRVRLRGRVSWSTGVWSTSLFLNYFSHQYDPANKLRVNSSTTVDWSVRYQLPGGFGPLKNSEFALTVTNIFNLAPPFVNSRFTPYDAINSNILGRVVGLELRKKW